MIHPVTGGGGPPSGRLRPAGFRPGRWLCGGLILLGVAALAWSGYDFWQSQSDADAASARSVLVVDEPNYVARPPFGNGMLRVSFTMRNPGSRPTRVVGAGEG